MKNSNSKENYFKLVYKKKNVPYFKCQGKIYIYIYKEKVEQFGLQFNYKVQKKNKKLKVRVYKKNVQKKNIFAIFIIRIIGKFFFFLFF